MSNSGSQVKPSVYRNMLRGAGWAVLMRWGIRCIGLVSTVILARLLTPEDFGIAAMGALVMGLLQGFAEFGATMLLIREPDATREHCDTAWTAQLLQSVFLSVLLVSIAPLAARYFAEPRLTPVIYLLAIDALLAGTENIGMTLVRKELDFTKDFRFIIYKRLLNLSITIPLALLLRNYWALVIGQLSGTAFGVLLSYRMHPYRPRLSLTHVREYLKFSLVIIPFNIGKFLNNKVDVFVVGGIGNTAQMGIYNIASELSAMVTREIIIPTGRGLYPNYAKLAHDLPQLTAAYLHVIGVLGTLCFPVGFGLCVVAGSFVGVVLGEQWDMAVPLMQWLAIYGMLTSLMGAMSGQILIVAGHEHLSSLLMWVQLAVLVPAVVISGQFAGVQGIAIGATLAAVVTFPVIVYFLSKALPLKLWQLFQALWRPLLASSMMTGIVKALHVDGLPLAVLLFDVTVGAVSYVIALLVLWYLAGRPQGIEHVLIGFIADKLFKKLPA